MDAHYAEIRLFAYDAIPKGWAPCNGQLLDIRDNQPLFALIGTRFGGDGHTKFALPDLRGRIPAHMADHIGEQLAIRSSDVEGELQPYLALSYCISLNGLFPTRD